MNGYAVRRSFSSVSPRLSTVLMKLGTGISLAVVSVPAVFWGIYRLLQLCGYSDCHNSTSQRKEAEEAGPGFGCVPGSRGSRSSVTPVKAVMGSDRL